MTTDTADHVTVANGQPPLPASRQAAVEQGLHMYQEVAAERDALRNEVAQLKTQRAGDRVVIDAQASQIEDMRSRVETAMLVRDQAVADRAKYETLFASIGAQLRAFHIPAVPLVTAKADDAGAGQ